MFFLRWGNHFVSSCDHFLYAIEKGSPEYYNPLDGPLAWKEGGREGRRRQRRNRRRRRRKRGRACIREYGLLSSSLVDWLDAKLTFWRGETGCRVWRRGRDVDKWRRRRILWGKFHWREGGQRAYMHARKSFEKKTLLFSKSYFSYSTFYERAVQLIGGRWLHQRL